MGANVYIKQRTSDVNVRVHAVADSVTVALLEAGARVNLSRSRRVSLSSTTTTRTDSQASHEFIARLGVRYDVRLVFESIERV